jgi:hypothetical protein
VEDGETRLKRTNPFAVAAVMHYHALRHWSFYLGPGYEFESHENLFLVRAGTEYSFEITEDFEIALNLIYENKEKSMMPGHLVSHSIKNYGEKSKKSIIQLLSIKEHRCSRS